MLKKFVVFQLLKNLHFEKILGYGSYNKNSKFWIKQGTLIKNVQLYKPLIFSLILYNLLYNIKKLCCSGVYAAVISN